MYTVKFDNEQQQYNSYELARNHFNTIARFIFTVEKVELWFNGKIVDSFER